MRCGHSYTLPNQSREFTQSERKVARLVAVGLSSRAIARELSRSYGGVRNKIKTIYDKSGMSSRLEFSMWYWHTFPEELLLKRTAETL